MVPRRVLFALFNVFDLFIILEEMLHKTTKISNVTVITELLIQTANETRNLLAA